MKKYLFHALLLIPVLLVLFQPTQAEAKANVWLSDAVPFTITPTSLGHGGPITLPSVKIMNDGDVSSGTFRIGFYISTNTSITTSDTRIKDYSVASIAAGSNRTYAAIASDDIAASTLPGTYYIGAIVDYTGVVDESNENDNDEKYTTLTVPSYAITGSLGTTGATVSVAGGSGSCTVTSSNYTCSGMPQGVGMTITPSKSGGTFSPASFTYNLVPPSSQTLLSGPGFNFTFTPTQAYTLDVTKSGTGSGTVTSSPTGINCGSDCTQNYNSGTSVTLTAAPASGSVTSNWSGCGTVSGQNCTVSMTSSKTVTVTFNTAPVTNYTLSVTKNGTGSGTVTSSPSGINCGSDCTNNYNNGDTVVLTAQAASGSTFTGWSNNTNLCADINGNICTVVVDSTKTIAATFNVTAPSTYTVRGTLGTSGGNLSVSATGGGSCTVSGIDYTCINNPTGVNVTLTPSKSGGTFSPASRTHNQNVTTTLTGQNFAFTPTLGSGITQLRAGFPFDIFKLYAGPGIRLQPDAATNKVTVSLDTRSLGLASCGTATTGKVYWDGTKLLCGTDVGGGNGDNLGNHTATQNINMNGEWLSTGSNTTLARGILIKPGSNSTGSDSSIVIGNEGAGAPIRINGNPLQIQANTTQTGYVLTAKDNTGTVEWKPIPPAGATLFKVFAAAELGTETQEQTLGTYTACFVSHTNDTGNNDQSFLCRAKREGETNNELADNAWTSYEFSGPTTWYMRYRGGGCRVTCF